MTPDQIDQIGLVTDQTNTDQTIKVTEISAIASYQTKLSLIKFEVDLNEDFEDFKGKVGEGIECLIVEKREASNRSRMPLK